MFKIQPDLNPIACCCGLDTTTTKNRSENYWRNRHMIGEGSSLTLAHPMSACQAQQHHRQHHQPYMLLTQPVILTNNQISSNNNNNNNNNQNKSFFAHLLQPTGQHQANYLTSPYAATILNTQNRYDTYMSSNFLNAPLRRIENPHFMATSSITSNNLTRITTNNNPLSIELPQSQQQLQRYSNNTRVDPNTIVLKNDVRKIGTLSSEIFRQLEVVEKQFDMSAHLEAVEKRGEVLTRELESNELNKYVNEDVVRRYHDQYLYDPTRWSIRFVEILKRPGQTLGLYINTTTFNEAPERMTARDGVIITRIGYDSPVFNGNILNVGDEILSVNFIDIYGMSLDDVVIVMSIPKRLILALRSPRPSAQQQRQGNISTVTGVAPYNRKNQQASTIEPSRQFPNQHQTNHNLSINNNNNRFEQERSSFCTRDNNNNNTNHNEPRSVEIHSTNYDTQHDALRLQQNKQYHYKHQQPDNNIQKQNKEASFETGPKFSSQSYNTLNIFDTTTNTKNQSSINIANYQLDNMHHSPSVIADHRSYDINQCPTASQTLTHPKSAYSSYSTPSTPYRSLSHKAQTTTATQSIFNPMKALSINSDTKEQTSYFSSSIDAINKELKELRRQRMALDNLNNNISSLDFNDTSIDDDRPIILPSQINTYPSLSSSNQQQQHQSINRDLYLETCINTSRIQSNDESYKRDHTGNIHVPEGRDDITSQATMSRVPRILPSPPNSSNITDLRSQSAFPDFNLSSCP